MTMEFHYNLICITSSVKSKLVGKADDFGILKEFSSERVNALDTAVPEGAKSWGCQYIVKGGQNLPSP